MDKPRSRYAPDGQVRRLARLAAEIGIRPAGIRLGADGSVTLLDTDTASAMRQESGEDPDAALAKWESEHGLARSP